MVRVTVRGYERDGTTYEELVVSGHVYLSLFLPLSLSLSIYIIPI